jgi:hypothetical protein
MMRVVHPAYHCLPNGGQGSFCPSANRLFNCDLVFATILNQLCPYRRAGKRTLSGVGNSYMTAWLATSSESCRVCIPISMAPAVDPAMMDRKGLGCFFFSPVCAVDAMIAVLPSYGLQVMLVLTGMGTFFLAWDGKYFVTFGTDGSCCNLHVRRCRCSVSVTTVVGCWTRAMEYSA